MNYLKQYFFAIPLYNLFIGIGIIMGMLVLDRRLKITKTASDKVDKIYLSLVISISIGFLGAFFFDALAHGVKFTFVNIANNTIGLTFYGGFLFGTVIFSSLIKIFRLDLITTINTVIPSLVISHAFGRIGCFFGGCCYGKSVSLFSLTFQFPTQLSESIFLFILYICLIKKVKFDDYLIIYLFSYGIWRFFIEFVRGDFRGILFNQNLLSPAQSISIVLVLSSVFLKWLQIKRKLFWLKLQKH